PVINQSISRTTHIFDPATGTWTDGPLLATARTNHSAVVLANGKLLVAGGTGPPGIGAPATIARAAIYDPASNTRAPAGTMKIPRVNFGLIALPDGRALALGGNSAGAFVNSSEIFDPSAPVATAWAYTSNGTQTTMSEPKGFPNPFLLNGKVVVAGGNNPDSSTATAAVEVFDPATQIWSRLTDLNQARTQHFP